MRNHISIIGAAVALTAALFVPAPPAAAGPNCSTGYHCGWDIGFDTGSTTSLADGQNIKVS